MSELMLFPRPTHKSERVQLCRSEKRLLALIAQGYPTKEIAFRLRLQVSTVHVNTWRLCQKILVHGKIQAALWAIGHPEAFELDVTAEIMTHRTGCTCPRPYCTIQRGLLDLAA